MLALLQSQPSEVLIFGSFGLYLLLILVFAWRYHVLHHTAVNGKLPGHFIFADHLVRARRQRRRHGTARRLARLRAASSAVRKLIPVVQEAGEGARVWLGGFSVTSVEGVRFQGVEDTPGPPETNLPIPPSLFVTLETPQFRIGHTFERDAPETVAEILPLLNEFLDHLSASISRDRLAAADLSQSSHTPRFLDFLYFSTMTQATAGYGDIIPNSTRVRFLAMVQVLLGYAIVVVLINILIA